MRSWAAMPRACGAVMEPAECLRLALACAAANTLRAGAGVFYTEDVDRLLELVDIEEVAAA